VYKVLRRPQHLPLLHGTGSLHLENSCAGSFGFVLFIE
jgi:hypothetical protein